MNRNERAAIWRDELAHPNSPTTRAAMRQTGASDDLVAEWADLEGDNEPGSDWTVYEDFLKGAIGIAEDHDPKGEFDTPPEHARRLRYLAGLWEELSMSNNEPHNQMGESRSEKEAYDRLLAAREAAKEKFDPQGRTVVRIPGDVLAIVKVEGFDTTIDKVVFSPHASSAGYFGPHAEFWDFPEGVSQEQVDQHLDIQSVDGRFWRAMQEHLPTHDVKWEE